MTPFQGFVILVLEFCQGSQLELESSQKSQVCAVLIDCLYQLFQWDIFWGLLTCQAFKCCEILGDSSDSLLSSSPTEALSTLIGDTSCKVSCH